MLTKTEVATSYLVLLDKNNVDKGINLIRQNAGLNGSCRIEHTSATSTGVIEAEQAQKADIIILDKLGIALVNQDGDRQTAHSLIAASRDKTTPILAVEAEQTFQSEQPISSRAISSIENPLESYLQGYRDSINQLVEQFFPQGKSSTSAIRASSTEINTEFDESEATWGLQITGVVNSKYSGRGVKVAILDSGLDFEHPDFIGRSIVSRSFISGVPTAQDGGGSGTYNTGIVCGPRRPEIGPRYGIAYESDIYIAKVLNDNGGGSSINIVQGLEWAIHQGCPVINLPLGSNVRPGERFQDFFEAIASRALEQGSLIIAGVGSSSRRPAFIDPVGSPANCPSILAAGAIDSRLNIADFSNAGINPNGGEVDLVAPGIDIYSSHLMPKRYTRQSGTARTASYVAGIATLYAEAYPEARGEALWNLLIRHARRLPLSSRDVGSGLVQAPRS